MNGQKGPIVTTQFARHRVIAEDIVCLVVGKSDGGIGDSDGFCGSLSQGKCRPGGLTVGLDAYRIGRIVLEKVIVLFNLLLILRIVAEQVASR